MAIRARIAVPVIIIAAISLAGSIVGCTTHAGIEPTSKSSLSLDAASGDLRLPRIPWEGGPAYWDQFPTAKAAGWSNPSFFPIAIWYDSVGSDKEIRADQSYGINSYIGENKTTNYWLFARNKAFVLQHLNNTPPGGSAQPGLFLVDEPDGRTTSSNDLAMVRNLVTNSPDDGRFKEINFSITALSGSEPQVNKANFEEMVESYVGPVSADKYYYTQPSCYDTRYLIVHIDPGHCRTASSYGATVRAVRMRMATSGRLKPVWNFVENLSGAPDPDHFHAYMKPGQLEGAVMDSIINEARGILYFNQSFAGACRGGNIIRQVQIGALPCAQPQMNAMRQVDLRIRTLAPVINTQSYSYSFGENLDTMLKAYDGNAYIFSMISGAPASEPGERTFTLPAALTRATSVQVLNENRSIPIADGRFTDNFASEYTFHIYKVAIPGIG